MNIFRKLQKRCHNLAVKKGFWACEKGIDKNTNLLNLSAKFYHHPIERRNDGEMIALMHSELSEMLEELRNVKIDWDKVGEELADLFIRGFDYAEGRNIDLYKCIVKKMKKNELRPHKHGKSF